MALAGSAWKHVSSSGVSTRLGARPAHAPDFGRRDASSGVAPAQVLREPDRATIRVASAGVLVWCHAAIPPPTLGAFLSALDPLCGSCLEKRGDLCPSKGTPPAAPLTF